MEWILCSLESPNKDQEVLLTFKNSAGLHVGEATFKSDTYFYVVQTDNESYEDAYGIPVAWMSKPIAYIP